MRASNEYAREDRAKTWWLLAVTLLAWATSAAVSVFAPWFPLRFAAAVVSGLVIVRVFIFYHDWLHGAVLTGSTLGTGIMRLFGYYLLAGASVWKETHDYHHKHTAKIVGASIGSYPVVTLGMWRGMTPRQRFAYRAARHPVTMLFGYVFLFVWGMCLSAFKRQPRQHLDGFVALLFHGSLTAAVTLAFNFEAAILTVVFPVAMSTALGSYLFYAQHNFPDMQIRGRREWEYTYAALRSSSMFEMPPLMHWFTGNIGYHHVHHLNHRIPFYRLPEAMAAMPELQHPGRTSWHPRDIFACLRGHVWDPRQGRMLSYAEAELASPDDNVVAAK
ncbi:MAG: fatty acid desaturase [Deltaproteobacteria bacterium]|nr:fatty acid desaturase [Deltaproteobacteria bacterium]